MSIEWREPEVVQAIDRPAHAGPPSRVRDVLPQPRVQGRRERVEGRQGHGRMMVPPYQNAKLFTSRTVRSIGVRPEVHVPASRRGPRASLPRVRGAEKGSRKSQLASVTH